MTIGSVEPMKQLHSRWAEQVQFVDVLIRQAHPGPNVQPYRELEQKLADGRRYQDDEGIAWPVLVDDLAGTVHQAYGGLADPTYLIDVDGRVAYYNMWTHAPTLHRALEALMRAGGRGVVLGGIDHTPHVLPALADGWRGLRRGLPQSFLDLLLAAPPAPISVWLGHRVRRMLAPLALRATPLPRVVRLAFAVGALGLAVAAVRHFGRRS